MLCAASWLRNRGFPNEVSSVSGLTCLYFHYADVFCVYLAGIASEPCSPDCGVQVVYAVLYVIISVIVPFYADCGSLSYWPCDSDACSSLVCSIGGCLWLVHCFVCTVLAVVSFPWNLVIVYTYTALTGL